MIIRLLEKQLSRNRLARSSSRDIRGFLGGGVNKLRETQEIIFPDRKVGGGWG